MLPTSFETAIEIAITTKLTVLISLNFQPNNFLYVIFKKSIFLADNLRKSVNLTLIHQFKKVREKVKNIILGHIIIIPLIGPTVIWQNFYVLSDSLFSKRHATSKCFLKTDRSRWCFKSPWKNWEIVSKKRIFTATTFRAKQGDFFRKLEQRKHLLVGYKELRCA